ncbi:MAG TPA: pyridoxamine 5'-phosphate oxidase [Burkholderiales bacterium]
MNIAQLRNEYTRAALDEANVLPDPYAQFSRWLTEAIQAKLPEPTAMTLATADAQGRPAARIVLLKGIDGEGFSFYTNYDSRKGHDLDANPHASLLFYWAELERQVRVEGKVERVPDAESDAYYLSRPLGSRIGAWASPQSRVMNSREWLEARVQQMTVQHGDNPPRPPHWGGYRVVPEVLEFWQGRRSRLHDRIRYRRDGGAWIRERLAP